MRGQEVVLLDDESEGSTADKRDSLLTAASSWLSLTSAKRVTIRLVAEPDSVIALTMVEDANAPVLVRASR
jgi:hypothetical protein